MKKLIGRMKGAGRKLTTFLLLAGAGAYPAFGQAQQIVPVQLEGLADQVLKALTGGLAKTIISCAFGASCIAYAVNKDNEQAKQKILAVVIATALLTAADWIIGAILEAGGAG
jgi:hypothetical protein